MDTTDLTNVLVSVFKLSSTGMGHFAEMHFLSFSQPPFDAQDLKFYSESFHLRSLKLVHYTTA